MARAVPAAKEDAIPTRVSKDGGRIQIGLTNGSYARSVPIIGRSWRRSIELW